MVIYEPSPCHIVHLGADLAIDFSEQEALDDIVTYEEVIDEDNANNQRAERGKTRDRLERYMRDVRAVIDKRFVQLPRDHRDFHDQIDLSGVEHRI